MRRIQNNFFQSTEPRKGVFFRCGYLSPRRPPFSQEPETLRRFRYANAPQIFRALGGKKPFFFLRLGKKMSWERKEKNGRTSTLSPGPCSNPWGTPQIANAIHFLEKKKKKSRIGLDIFLHSWGAYPRGGEQKVLEAPLPPVDR